MKTDLTEDEAKQLRESLTEKYRIFISNPEHTPQVAYTMWVDEGDEEFPILTNTGGLTMYQSRSKSVGEENALELGVKFFDAIAYSYHWVMCYMPGSEQLFEEIESQSETFYENGKVPEHEQWAISMIVSHFLHNEEGVHTEFEPILRYTDSCTEFSTPEVSE